MQLEGAVCSVPSQLPAPASALGRLLPLHLPLHPARLCDPVPHCPQVRGKDFRHEKTKKKRGSYKGGEIDPHARCSYKFESGAPLRPAG